MNSPSLCCLQETASQQAVAEMDLEEERKSLALALKGALHAGGERFPPCKGLPLLLELHLGNSLLAGGLLQLLAPLMQGLGEFVELQLADLESLAARLELGSLSCETGLLLGNSLLP